MGRRAAFQRLKLLLGCLIAAVFAVACFNASIGAGLSQAQAGPALQKELLRESRCPAPPRGQEAQPLCSVLSAVRLLVYNRVPKTGSSTMQTIIKNAAKANGFKFVSSKDYVHQRLPGVAEEKHFAQQLKELLKGHQRVVFDRHVYWVNLTQHLAGVLRRHQIAYINLLREPISMLTSTYYFHQDCRCTFKQDWCKVDKRDVKCEVDINRGWSGSTQGGCPDLAKIFTSDSSAYLCGHHQACFGGCDAEEAWSFIQRVISREYAVVGTLEDMPLFLEVLARRLPQFFGGRFDASEYLTLKRLPEGGRHAARVPANNGTKGRINRFFDDYPRCYGLPSPHVVYDYVRRRFLEQSRECRARRRQPSRQQPGRQGQRRREKR